MNNLSKCYIGWLKWSAVLVLLGWNTVNGLCQFSGTIGLPLPIEEKAVGGLIAPTGGYVILGDNVGHPSGISNGNGDMELVWLDNLGNLSQPSKMLGQSLAENATWIEKNVFCSSTDHYVISGNSQNNIEVTMTDLTGNPVWARTISSPPNIETSVWAEMDANGLIHVVGNDFDPSNGASSVVVVQMDCNGNDNWRLKYYLNGFALTATSATTFATAPGGLGICYITGRATPLAGGDEQVFILRINTSGGSPVFIKTYDVVPGWSDLGTCIQGSTAGQGEIWVSGLTNAPASARNVLMLKTDLNGVPIWAFNYDIAGGEEYAKHFELAANNKLIVTGRAEDVASTQGPYPGDCLLMRLDAGNGLADFTRVFTTNDFSSTGNRVEVTANDEYFITGESLEFNGSSPAANNILAIRTDPQGLVSTNCYHNVMAHPFSQAPVVTSYSVAAMTIGQVDNNLPLTLTTASYTDQQNFCSPPPPPDCDFTWASSGCFQMQFTGTTLFTIGGIYTFKWDIGCDGTIDVTVNTNSNTSTVSHNFPCGGGTFPVCLSVTDPFGTICTVMHQVTVGSCSCWSVSNTGLVCSAITGNPTAYDFTMNVTSLYPGATNCTYTLAAPAGAAFFAGPVFTPNGSTTTISGTVVWPSNVPLPTSLTFTIGATCTCPGGPSYSCNIPVTIATVCCKKIAVFDQVVCESAATYDVPLQTLNAAILHNITQVTWYVQAKPPGGPCPTVYWGGIPYQDGPASSLTQLHLYPAALANDLCVYAVVHLNDGPCKTIFSNIACISRCAPTTCTVAGYDTCYMGTPIVPRPLTVVLNAPANACFSSIEWFDENNNFVQNGGTTYTPTGLLSMSDPTQCYEDFFYTVQITDDCGQRSCQARVRLYSDSAPKGQLAIDPFEPQPFCPNEDATLVFTPGCAGDPKMWTWHRRPCIGGLPEHFPEAGTMNTVLNTNQLNNSWYYYVESQNGVCPADTVQLKIEVKSPVVITGFTAVPDNCVKQQVTLQVSFAPCTIAGCNTLCTCTYTVDWYKDGFLIGSTPASGSSASFIYAILPLAGNYYAVVKDDCCQNNTALTPVEVITPACVPIVGGPCFICDNMPVKLMGFTVIPVNTPCPYPCTYQWYIWDTQTSTWIPLAGATFDSYMATVAGLYRFESTCNGCTESALIDLKDCMSVQITGSDTTKCGLIVFTEEVYTRETSPVRVFPNPSTGEVTVEWTKEAPKGTQLFITDAVGRQIRSVSMPDAAVSLTLRLHDLPSGLYFIKIRSADTLYQVAKVMKE